MYDYKIICIPDAIAYIQFSFEELVKLIHVNIHEKLRSEVAERQTHSCPFGRMETINNLFPKPHGVVIRNMSS